MLCHRKVINVDYLHHLANGELSLDRIGTALEKRELNDEHAFWHLPG
jgi:hypothetical protein